MTSNNDGTLTPKGVYPEERCERNIETDHYGERLKGCPSCGRWHAATEEWCRLAPDDTAALRELKAAKQGKMKRAGS
jgi:hypothetical protein